MTRMQSNRWTAAALLGALFVWAAGADTVRGQPHPPTEYVTEDAFAWCEIRWAKVRPSPFWGYLYDEWVTESARQWFKWYEPFQELCDCLKDWEDVESMRLVLVPEPVGELPVGGYVVLRFTREIDLAMLTEKMSGAEFGEAGEEKRTPDGFRYRTFPKFQEKASQREEPRQWGTPPACLLLEPRSAILAPESMLKKILAAKVGRGALVERIRRDPKESPVRIVALATDGTVPLVEKYFGRGYRLRNEEDADPLDLLWAHLKDMKAFELRMATTGDQLAVASVEVPEEKPFSAVRVWLEKVRNAYPSRLEPEIRLAEMLVGMDANAAYRKELPGCAALEFRRPEIRFTLSKPKHAEAMVVERQRASQETWAFYERFAPEEKRGTAAHFRTSYVADALSEYCRTHDRLPTDIVSKEGRPLLSWRLSLLPIFGLEDLQREFKLDEAWESPHNKSLLKKLDKSRFFGTGPETPALTPCLAFRGPDTLFPMEGRKLPVAFVTDGLDNTLAVALVRPEYAVPWTQPFDIDFDVRNPTACLKYLPDDCDWLLGCAGGIRNTTRRLKPEILKALITPDGGEKVDADFILNFYEPK